MTEVQLDRFTKQGSLKRNWSRDVLNVLVSVYICSHGLVNVKLVNINFKFRWKVRVTNQN